MKYEIWCEISYKNWLTAKSLGLDMSWNGYICSCIGKESVQILIINLVKITGLRVEEKKINAKEEDFYYTLQNVQHRLYRLNKEIRMILV